jgi:prevent-host-death family protein
LKILAILSTMGEIADSGVLMKTMSAKDAKNGFGLLIDTALVEPVTIEKHGRPVVVVISMEEFERLSDAAAAKGHRPPPKGTQKKDT